MYTQDSPKWVKASVVEYASSGYVNVVAYGERFELCTVQCSSPVLDTPTSDVLVYNSRGDWLRVWFFDADVVGKP